MSTVFKKQKVNYWFDTFKHLKSFDVVPYQHVIDLYLNNHNSLNKDLDKEGGDNERPLNSDTEKIDFSAFWLGHSPVYYDIDPFKEVTLKAKADVVSMDMKGVNKTWDHWIYLELPGELFEKYQTSVHSNPDVTIYKQFLQELDKGELTKERIKEITKKYNKKHPEIHKFEDFFEEHQILQWSADLHASQYVSIKNNGLLYPICYTSSEKILFRGTHRALHLGMSGSDVPIFLQYPKLGKDPLNYIWTVDLQNHFDQKFIRMKINIFDKKLEFYKGFEPIGTY